MRKDQFGMIADVGFDEAPFIVFIADLLAYGADRQVSAQDLGKRVLQVFLE